MHRNLLLRNGGALAALGLWAVLAPGAQAADALNGKNLYLNGPASGGTACAACHGASPAANVNHILSGANQAAAIGGAIAANRGGMGALYNGKFTDAEIADIAAFIGNPGVTAAPAPAQAPASLSFGGATVGQASAPLGTTLTNAGNAALNISAIGVGGNNSGDFSVTGGTCAAGGAVAAGGNCTVQVVFKPGAAGARSATLNISHNGTGGVSSVALSGTGNAAASGTVALSATSLDFGAVASGAATAVQTITVTNSGQAAISFSSIAVSGANANLFTIGGTCATGASVAAGASCTVTLRATPTSAGAFSASLALGSNASNASVTVALSGTASAAAPAIAANPGAVAFGAQTIGAGAATQNVTVTNNGNVALNFTSIAVSGSSAVTLAGGSGNCGAGSLAAGASCNVALAFAPTAKGDVTATLLVRSNAPDLSVKVTGSGTSAAVARPALSEAGPLAFAATQVGQQTAAHTLTLGNGGNAALTIASLVLSGANPGDFALAGTCATGSAVSPGGNCTIAAAFKPTAAGARSADLVLLTDGGAQFSVRLNGDGVAVPAGTPTLGSNPQSFDFGAAAVGAASPVKRFTLTNTGSAALVLNSATFTGPYAISSGEANACGAFPVTLAAGASCELPVRFTPATTGSAAGSVVLQAAGGSWSIALSGSGDAAAPAAAAATGAPQSQNRGGGGCSAAANGDDPMLAILAVLAGAVLLWRRRQARARALLALCGATAALSGCALPPVQPWEKGELARPDMLIQGDPLETRFNEHIYASKEGASGGSGVGGGGCGCN